MTHLQSHANYRSPRVQLTDITPAVLRMPDGRRARGELETISLTGGLLSMSTMLDRGSRVKLMFLTHTGSVFGLAEMLSPISSSRQPFRFVAIEGGDQRRLRATVRSSCDLYPDPNPGFNPDEQAWIEKYRATLMHQNPAQHGAFRVALGVFTLLTLCLGTIYLVHVHVLK
jgi:hypothetical protein